MMQQKRSLISCLLVTLILSSCAVGPTYHRPRVELPNQFKEAHSNNIQLVETPLPVAWWEIFHDAQLNELETQLNKTNQTIQIAYHHYYQAQALVDEARAGLFPSLAGSVSFSRIKRHANTINNNGTLTNQNSTLGSSYTWQMNATWEPDLWGRVRRTIESTEANAKASAALLAATQLSTQASLAQFYFECRGLDTDQLLLQNSVQGYQKLLRYAQHRYEAGVSSQADLIQAKSQLQLAQAASVNNGVLRAQYEHAIAVLIGVPPADFSFKSRALSDVPPIIPLAMPSHLLERRPDIIQAEQLMAQANADIGVAVAAYFPSLTLTGDISEVTKKLFSIPALNWAVGAEVAQTILDGGLRRASVKGATEDYLASVASYRQTVLTALQEVEDNLASLRILSEQARFQTLAAENASVALKLVTKQYQAGTVDNASVLTAKMTADTATKTARDLSYLRMVAAVRLIKALGGGWEASSNKMSA